MEWPFIAFSLLVFFVVPDRSAYGQGTMVFNNLGEANGKVIISSGQGWFLPLQQDLNFNLGVVALGGGSLLLQRSWLLSDGTAKGISVGPGLFADPTHSVIVLPGVAPGQAREVTVSVWSGNYNTFEEASDAGAAFGRTTGLIIAGTIEAPPLSLTSMRDLVIPIPEPRTITLAIIGTALCFLCPARAKKTKG